MDTYINMRIKIPHFLHAQLLRKQKEMNERVPERLSLQDATIAVLAEAFLLEYQYKQYRRETEGKEELEGTNEHEDVLHFRAPRIRNVEGKG